MDFEALVNGPLLTVSFTVLALGLTIRGVLFLTSLFKAADRRVNRGLFLFTSLLSWLLPLNRAARRRPIYTATRYVFHFCLLAVPLGLAGHISLWEESFLGWSWPSLPTEWADGLTLLLLILAGVFMIRRLALAASEPAALPVGLILIPLVSLPFASGYFLVHGGLEAWPFLDDNIYLIHLLSGQVMIAATAFLFCRTKLNPGKCTGCASCSLACPTGALSSLDERGFRYFSYNHYCCLACGACLGTCPEGAAGLRHQFSLVDVFRPGARRPLRQVELAVCRRCAQPFAPQPQQARLSRSLEDDYLDCCPTCRQLITARQNWADWTRK